MDGLTLHKAIRCNRIGVVRALLSLGFNVNEREADQYGKTPLYVAVGCENEEIVKVLIAAGAAVNAKITGGKTSLHAAVNNEEILRLLLAAGANVNIKDDEGNTPLHLAVGRMKITVFLSNAGADVSVKNNRDESALHWALERRSFDVIKILIEAGADVNEKSPVLHRTALHVAVEQNDAALIEYLLRRGACIDSTDVNYRTPLHYGAICNEGESHLNAMRVLLENNADICARDVDGMTPVDFLERDDGRISFEVLHLVFYYMLDKNEELDLELKRLCENNTLLLYLMIFVTVFLCLLFLLSFF